MLNNARDLYQSLCKRFRFFDLQKTKLDFVVKINAITAGTYIMPGARCEAMYNNDYIATKQTKTVSVTK